VKKGFYWLTVFIVILSGTMFFVCDQEAGSDFYTRAEIDKKINDLELFTIQRIDSVIAAEFSGFYNFIDTDMIKMKQAIEDTILSYYQLSISVMMQEDEKTVGICRNLINQSIQQIPDPWPSPGDTVYLKVINWQDTMQVEVILSDVPMPIDTVHINESYIDSIKQENGYTIYYLKGDSLEITWNHDYRDINGNDIPAESLFFHVAYEDNEGNVFSLKPNPNITHELSLVMKGIKSGLKIPAVAAFRYGNKGQRIYSEWIKSKQYGWMIMVPQ